jgi:hypothetical protein
MIELPSHPAPQGASAGLIDFGGFLTPGLGGEVQRIDRMGNRFKLAVTMPPMRSVDKGRIFVSRLIRGKTEGVLMEFPLLGFKPGSPGAPVVDGAGQSGRTLVVKDCTPNYVWREGQFFSLIHAGRRYLHNVDEEAICNSSGEVELSISPMLRIEPDDEDVIEAGKPMIEGFVMGEEWSWSMSLEHHINLDFELVERS